jgi:lysophospholipase L1-like esterase
MFGTSGQPVGVRVRKLALLTVGLVPAVLIFVLTLFWLYDHVPGWFYWKAGLVFLIALEVAYWHMVVLTFVGALVLGFLLFSGRRQRRHPIVSRGFLLCVSFIFGLIAAETTSAVWQRRSHERTAVPVGGLREEALRKQSSRTALIPRDIKLPTAFPDGKADSEIDLLVVGESSAEGVPYNYWVSIGKIIGWQLEEAIPGRPIRVETLAASGQTLEMQHERLSTLTRRPDVLIIYCGHNEFSSRFPPSRDRDYYFDERLPTVWTLLADRLEAVSPLTGLIRETAEKCRIAIPPPIDGKRALVDAPVYALADYTVLLIDFRRRLEAIVSYAERIGAIPILIVPPANDTGFEPNRSFLPARTTFHEREAFRRDFLAARRLEATDPKRSLEQFRALLARQPEFAETHYRVAQLLERDAAWSEAYEHYVLARDLDGYPMRILSAFQHAYHEVASRHSGILIDGQSYFHAIGRHGLLDDNLFNDGMHPSLRGQIALAQTILQALQKRKAFGWSNDSPAPLIDPARCVKHFGLVPGAWKYICVWGTMFYDLTAPLRYDSSHRLQMKVVFATAANRIEAGEAPEAVGLPNVGVPAPVPAVPIP